MAEIGTLHMEYTYLSEITGNPIYLQKIERIRNFLENVEKPYNGLYPSEINVISGEWSSGILQFYCFTTSHYIYLLIFLNFYFILLQTTLQWGHPPTVFLNIF